MEIIQEKKKYHAGIDLRNIDCQNGNAICVGGYELKVGYFGKQRIENTEI